MRGNEWFRWGNPLVVGLLGTPDLAVVDQTRENQSPFHGEHTCPRCHGMVYRVHRRFLDRCLSVALPVHRYRCGEMGCDWEGNLRIRRHGVLPVGYGTSWVEPEASPGAGWKDVPSPSPLRESLHKSPSCCLI